MRLESHVPLAEKVHALYREFGPSKQMGESSDDTQRPHFFLERVFLGEADLAILFNTRRCQHQCSFCALPFKSTKEYIGQTEIEAQFTSVLHQVKDSLGILNRLTIANEGSVFDERTYPQRALINILTAVSNIPNITRVVFESRHEYFSDDVAKEASTVFSGSLNLLTGFETLNAALRRELGKDTSIESFETFLDKIASNNWELTTYVLFKPGTRMSDADAYDEASDTINYLSSQCKRRGVPITIRLNLMYLAQGTQFAKRAHENGYVPPSLSDVLRLAVDKRNIGIPVYLGLTSEGLAKPEDTYRSRSDFSQQILRAAILNNQTRQSDWSIR